MTAFWEGVLAGFGIAIPVGAIAILIVDILSRIRPYMNTKGSHLIIMLVMVAGGLGLMLKAYTENRSSNGEDSSDSGKKKVGG